jgi:hypothetical protein
VSVVRGVAVLASRTISPEALHPVRLELGEIDPAGIRVRTAGGVGIRATLSREDHRPWGDEATDPDRLALTVAGPEETVVVGEPAEIRVTVVNRAAEPARQVTLEIGLPPGCDVDPRAVEGPGVERVERGEAGLAVYLGDLDPGAACELRVPFTPWCRLDVRTAPSRAYEYYVPDRATEHPPVRVRAE